MEGKEIAMYDIHGAEASCYDRLRHYCRALKMINPGNAVDYMIVHVIQNYLWIFISFEVVF